MKNRLFFSVGYQSNNQYIIEKCQIIFCFLFLGVFFGVPKWCFYQEEAVPKLFWHSFFLGCIYVVILECYTYVQACVIDTVEVVRETMAFVGRVAVIYG